MANCNECNEEVYFKGKCRKHYRLQWNTKNRQKVNEYSKIWKQTNKEEIRIKDAERYKIHKEKETPEQKQIRLQKQRESYTRNKEQILKKKKITYENRNKEEFKIKIKLKAFKRYHSKPQVKLANICRKRLSRVLEKKTMSTSTLIGCSWEELKGYLESKFYPNPVNKEIMSWDNLGKNYGKWQIDHIVPLSSFDLTVPEELKKACHYSNLQPLWYEDHLEKTRLDIFSESNISHKGDVYV
jgi:hypothetical protein